MKKSVILIISTLSLLAIILIGLIFQRAEVYNVTQYVTGIACTDVRIGDELYPCYFDDRGTEDKSDDLYRLFDPDNPPTPDNPTASLPLEYVPELTMDIIYEVLPYDATNSSVSFFTDPSSTIARVDVVTGRVVFMEGGTETFTLRANDNSNATARIRIRAKLPDA